MKRVLQALLYTSCVIMLYSPVSRAQTQNVFFVPPTYKDGQQAQVGDLNGDGKADLVFEDGTVLLGNQDGTLHAGKSWIPSGLTLGSPIQITLADFNGDGRLDLLIVEQNTFLVLLGNGDGTFQTPVSTTTGAAFQPFFVADSNGDGRLDVLMNTGGAPLVFLGNGDGTFKLAGTGPSFAGAIWLGVGDFNGDGKVDILVSSTGGLGVLLGNGDGTFQSSPVLSNLPGCCSAVIGDLNGDGHLDVIMSTSSSATNPVYSNVVFLGKGDGTFASAGVIPAQAQDHMDWALSDVDKDGKLDLVIAYLGYVQTLLGKGDGTFTPRSTYFLNDISQPTLSRLIIADFNGDGNADVASTGALYFGNGDGTFRGNSATLMPSTFGLFAISDFDRDGNIDIACLPIQPGGNSVLDVTILFGDGTGNFPDVRTVPVSQAQPGANLGTADVNGDGIPDLVIATVDTTGVVSLEVLLGKGDRTFGPAVLGAQGQFNLSLAPSGNSFPMVVADFNGDHKPDVAVLDFTGYVQVFLGNGDTTFKPSNVYFTGSQANSLVAADFNNDGNTDFVVGSVGGLGLLLGKGDGTFGPTNFFDPGLTDVSATADLNGDGTADLIVGTQILLGNGDGTFLPLPSQLPVVPTALGDVNDDGKLDVVGSTSTAIVYALGNGDGTFENAVPILPEGINHNSNVHVSSPLVADFNNDHRSDIAFGFQNEIVTVLSVAPAPTPDFIISGTPLLPRVVAPGNSALSTTSLTPIGGFSGSVALSCGPLPSGANCNFSPASLQGGGTSTLTITASASTPTGSYPVSIVGTGPANVHNAALTLTVAASAGSTTAGVAPNSLSFPQQAIGTTSSPRVVQLTNTGTAPLSVSAISVTGTSAAEFAQSNTCSATVPLTPGSSCQISVTFTPADVGTRNASVLISDNATGSSQFVALAGQAPGFSISSSTTTATVSAGQTATYAISLASSGGFNQAVALSCSGAPALTTCTISPSTVQLSGTSVSASVAITTTAPKPGLAVPLWPLGAMSAKHQSPARYLLVLLEILFITVLLSKLRAERTRSSVLTACAFLLGLCVAISSCGGGSGSTNNGGNSGTQAGTYTVTVSATPSGAPSTAHTVTLTLVVK